MFKKNPDERIAARELLKHRFVRNSKKTSMLVELIERHKHWIEVEGNNKNESEDDEATDKKPHGENSSNNIQWEFDDTIKGVPAGLSAGNDKKKKKKC